MPSITPYDQRPLAALEHLARIQTKGQVTLGLMRQVGCVVVTNDDHTCQTMLRKRKDKTLHQWLVRLDVAIGKAGMWASLPTRSTCDAERAYAARGGRTLTKNRRCSNLRA